MKIFTPISNIFYLPAKFQPMPMHTLWHTHTHIQTHTHMLSSVIIVMNGLSRQLALSTICHACDAGRRLCWFDTQRSLQKRDRKREKARHGTAVSVSEQLAGSQSRESQEMVNKWKSYADSRQLLFHSSSLSISLFLFPSPCIFLSNSVTFSLARFHNQMKFSHTI